MPMVALQRPLMLERVNGVGRINRRIFATTEDVADYVAALGPIDPIDRASGYADQEDESLTRIPLQDATEALVDTEDYPLVRSYRWMANQFGYVVARMGDGRDEFYMHRIVLMLGNESASLGDHKNHNKRDNRKTNLRPCTEANNHWNTRLSTRNTSGIKGIHKVPHGWRSRVEANGIVYTKYFKNIEDAVAWLTDKRREVHGEFACHAASEAMRHMLEKHIDEGVDYFAVQGAKDRERLAL